MATSRGGTPSEWNQSLAIRIDDWDQPPAVLVRAALALPRAVSGKQELISALLGALDAKSPHTAVHCVRVGRYAGLLAAVMELPEAQVVQVERCGLMHDVGKVGIPEGVLEKPGKLTSEEWGLIQLHPVIGASVLRGCRSMAALLPAIAMHHERWDGRGYPYGIGGPDIPLEARIIAVCDAFDTMTSERPYKAPVPVDGACRRLREAAGTQFEPELVQLFVDRVVPSLPEGRVRLVEPAT